MKKKYLLLVTVLVLGLIGSTTGSVSAYGKFPSYISGIQVQNLANSPATVTLTYFNPDGTKDITFDDPTSIEALGSRTYFPIHASDGFSGSVVVSSDQPMAAISNVLGLEALKLGAASYVALSSGSGTISLPLLMKGNSGIDTWFSVQNTDGGSDAVVNVSYSDGTTAGPVTIKPGSSHVFDQAVETHTSKVFAATITSTKSIAAVVIEETPDNLLYAYTGFVSGTTNPVMPLINSNNSGNFTGVQLQNAGGTETTVTISYEPSFFGTACTETQAIPAGASATYALFAFGGNPIPGGGSTTCIAERFVGSAKVTANSASMPLIAVVNQVNTATGAGEAYGSFDVAAATDTVVFPLIQDRNSGWYTGFSLLNVGTASTTVNCVFTNTTYTFSATIDAGKAALDIQGDKISDKYIGSATCSASGGVPIVGVLNEANGNVTIDGLMVYEGINVP